MLHTYPNDEYIKGVAPHVNQAGWVDATNLERQKYNLDADMCEAYKIEVFKKFLDTIFSFSLLHLVSVDRPNQP